MSGGARRAPRAARGRQRIDAVALALYDGLFAACAEEMGATLMRTAHSPNIKERLDHSCAVFDAAGRLVAQAAHIPVHLGSLPASVEAALALAPFRPGDTVLLNDPFAGGTHLPDLTLVSPVFLSGSRPAFFVASRAHHADVGGAAPGSMPLVRDGVAEGLRIPPIRLERAGRLEEDVLRLVLANVRTPAERRADLAAQLGAQRTGARRLAELASRSGARELGRAAAALIAHGERSMRRALAALPRGVFRFADALDDDGLGTQRIRIAVTLTIGGGRLRADFTGSAPQTPGPVNAVLPVTRAATSYAVRVVLGAAVPNNHGAFSRLEIRAPEGSVVNARPPAAVSAGNVETSQRIVDVVLGALAKAVPSRVAAASYGTMSNVLIGGVDPRRGTPFAYYETIGGGHGAGPTWSGESAMQAHMTNTRNTPIEALEHEAPLLVRTLAIRRGSGGSGARRGGDGIVRALEMRTPARVTVISERRVLPPYGLAGGAPGSVGRNTIRASGRARGAPGKFQVDLPAGAVLTVATPGGGGYGRARVARGAKRRRPLSRAARRARSRLLTDPSAGG